jgi:hypothetical protein
MNWIRVDVGIAADPKLHQFAKALKVRRAEAVGLFVMTLCQFPDHARDGDIAKVADETLAEWAGWTKKPATYAAAFRAVFCEGSSVVSGWDKHNGAPLRKADSDARRKREFRASRGDVPPDVAATSIVRDERDETNETGRSAVAVPCDSKKQFAVRSSTQNHARGASKGLTRVGNLMRVDWDALERESRKAAP